MIEASVVLWEAEELAEKKEVQARWELPVLVDQLARWDGSVRQACPEPQDFLEHAAVSEPMAHLDFPEHGAASEPMV